MSSKNISFKEKVLRKQSTKNKKDGNVFHFDDIENNIQDREDQESFENLKYDIDKAVLGVTVINFIDSQEDYKILYYNNFMIDKLLYDKFELIGVNILTLLDSSCSELFISNIVTLFASSNMCCKPFKIKI